MSAKLTTESSPSGEILDLTTVTSAQPQLLDLRSSNYSNYTNNLLGVLLDERTKMSAPSQSVFAPTPNYNVFSAFDMGRTAHLRRLSIRLTIYRASASSTLAADISDALIQEAYDMKKDPAEEANVEIIWGEMNSKELIKEIFNWFTSIDINDRKALKAGAVQLQWFVDDLLNNWPSSSRSLDSSKEKLWDDLFDQWRRLHPLHGEDAEPVDPRMSRVFSSHQDKTYAEQIEYQQKSLAAGTHSRAAAAVVVKTLGPREAKALDARDSRVSSRAKSTNAETVVDGEAKTPHQEGLPIFEGLDEVSAENSSTGEVGRIRSTGRVGNTKVNAKIEKVRISMLGVNGSAYRATGIITVDSRRVITIANIGQIREIFNMGTLKFDAERDEVYATISVDASPPRSNPRLLLRNSAESSEASDAGGTGGTGAVNDADTTIKLRNRMSELVISGSTSRRSRAFGTVARESSGIGRHNGNVEVRVNTDSPIPNEPCKPRKTRGDDYVDDGNLNFITTARDVQASSMLLIMATARFQISIGELIHTGFVKREYAREVDLNNSKSVRNLISWRDQFLERAFGPDYKSRPLRWLQLEKYWVLAYLEGRVCKTWNRLANAYNRVFKGTKQRAGELYVQFPDRDDEFMAVDRDAPWRLRSDIERVVTMWPEYRQIIRAANSEGESTANCIAPNDVGDDVIAANDVVDSGIVPNNVGDDDTSMDEEEDSMPVMPTMSILQAQAIPSPQANRAQGSKKRHQEESFDMEAPPVKKRSLRTRQSEVNYYWDSE